MSGLLRRIVLSRLSTLAAWPLLYGAAMATAQNKDPISQRQGLAGRYYLEGVREVGAELSLSAEGRFDFGIAFGGVERYAQGQWEKRQQVLLLTTDKPQPAGFALFEETSTLLGDYANDPEKPTLLSVRVSTPRLRLTWSNMQVAAEFSNGQTRQGLTRNNGMLGFLMRTEPEWQGATIRRVSVGYSKGAVEPVWFVPHASTKGLQVHFEPGPLMAPPAFEQAELRIDDLGLGVVLRVVAGGLGKVGWTLSRRP